MFQKQDKKLTKNILKRCIVEPLVERLLSKQVNDGSQLVTEIEALYGDSIDIIQSFTRVLLALMRSSQMLTPTLKDMLSQPI